MLDAKRKRVFEAMRKRGERKREILYREGVREVERERERESEREREREKERERERTL